METSNNQFMYGGVYFRKSNPPRGDWERDYQQAHKDGMNVFRHWFMWGSIEVAPGVYDFEEYDTHLDLAAKYGIKTIIAEMITSIPEWMFRKYSEALPVDKDGRHMPSTYSVSSATGGFQSGLCLDSPLGRELSSGFLTKLAERYKDHPGLYGYDIWNECNYMENFCYCEHTQAKFREWLRDRYGSLDALNKAWHKYSYAEWEDVMPPVVMRQYPDSLDWLQFRRENAYSQMEWRREIIRSVDKKCVITAHGTAATLTNLAQNGSDDWMAASKVESYGLTWVIARKGSESYKQSLALDLVRSSSRGKPYWHAEMQGGPLWLQPQVIGRKKDDARVATADDVRIWNMVSIAGGVSGILYLRWRSLLDGPLFGAFGLYNEDGTPNDRSEMAASINRWANSPDQKELIASKQISSDIGIVVIPETQIMNYTIEQASKGDFYARCVTGAYRGFFDNQISVDWVHIDDIENYSRLYIPYPIHITKEHANKIVQWVQGGGILISEGLPAYFGDHGHVGTSQPNYGFDQMSGAVQNRAEFMPDLGGEITFTFMDKKIDGGLFLQAYKKTQGSLGYYPEGDSAVVENQFGKGKILLVGTFPSEGYNRNPNAENARFFADVLKWAGVSQNACLSNPELQIKIRENNGKRYIFMLNTTAKWQESMVTLNNIDISSIGNVFWGGQKPQLQKGVISVVVAPKDALIFEIIPVPELPHTTF